MDDLNENLEKHSLTGQYFTYEVGDKVFWTDPDGCVCSGQGKFIKYVNEEVAIINKGGVETEVFITELHMIG